MKLLSLFLTVSIMVTTVNGISFSVSAGSAAPMISSVYATGEGTTPTTQTSETSSDVLQPSEKIQEVLPMEVPSEISGVTGTPTSTPEITPEAAAPTGTPTSTPEITPEAAAPTGTPTSTPEITPEAAAPTGTPTPEITPEATTPTAVPPIVLDKTGLAYTLFSASLTADCQIHCASGDVTGDIYAGNTFRFAGSKLKVHGSADTVLTSDCDGSSIVIDTLNPNIAPIAMPDLGANILARATNGTQYNKDVTFKKKDAFSNAALQTSGSFAFNNSKLSGQCYVIADQDIKLGIDTSTVTSADKFIVYSQNGDITVNGPDFVMNGILYAPNGTVKITSSTFTLNGRIIADRIELNCNSVTIVGAPEDFLPINDAPIVDAGEDAKSYASETYTLAGTVSDDAILLPEPELTWQMLTGPGEAIFSDPHTANPTVAFSAIGLYELQLQAFDGLQTTSDTVLITVLNDAFCKSYTIDEDFREGGFINTVPENDALMIDDTSVLNFMWVANSSKGTVLKINTRTNEIIGEFYSAPAGMGTNPTCTTVDYDGSVWVANRDGSSVVKIGLYENGGWIDKNGNGKCDTSIGMGDVLAWSNTGNADSLGGVSTAEDECILLYIQVPTGGTSDITVNADNNIWVSGTANREFVLLDGDTGEILRTEDGVGYGGYGSLIDENDVIWSANPLMRWDAEKSLTGANGGNWIGYSANSYALTIDSEGNVWNTSNAADSKIRKYAPDGMLIGTYDQGNYNAQGCVADQNDNIWIAHSKNQSTIGRLKSDGTYLGTLAVKDGPTGIAVDSEGYIWVVCYSGYIQKIDPNKGPMGSDGVTPLGEIIYTSPRIDGDLDNYSDMTGSTLTDAPTSATWTAVYDCEEDGAKWGKVNWKGEVYSDGVIEVLVSTSTDNVTFSEQIVVNNGDEFTLPAGRFVRLEVRMTRSEDGYSPKLHEITIASRPYDLQKPENLIPVVTQPQTALASKNVPYELCAFATDDAFASGRKLDFTWTCADSCVSFSDAKKNNPVITGSEAGTYEVTLTTSDGNTSVTSTTILTVVEPDEEGPTLTLTTDKDTYTLGETLNASLTASDNIAIQDVSLSIDGTKVNLTPDLTYSQTLSYVGKVTLTAIATDTSGNTTQVTKEILVIDPVPTPTPTPSGPPEYWVISEGDPDYGYEVLFQEENWNYGNNASFDPNNIEVCPNVYWNNGYAFYMTSRNFDEDLSFDARFTTKIDHGSSLADGIAFIISPNTVNNNTNGQSIGYGEITPSVVIEIDDYRNGGYRHHNELGEGAWIGGESNSHVAVMLNGNAGDHYAYAEWPELRTSGVICDVWVSYDGQEKVLYVYTAEYDAEGNVEKPATATLVLSIDLEQHFSGESTLYMGFTSATGASKASHNLLGFELDPMPGMHASSAIEFTSDIEDVTVGEPIEANGRIKGTGSTVELRDSEGNVIHEESLNPTGNYEQLFSIPTTDLEAGAYTLVITTTNENGDIETEEVEIQILEVVTPTPIPTVTDAPTPTPEEDPDGYTDGELFADIEDSQEGREITFISDITGTVTGTELQGYTIEVFLVESDEAVYTYTGTGEIVEGTVGTIDSTLLMNGFYKIVLRAYAVDGYVDDSIIVLVTGQAKIGNFSIAFVDMTVPIDGSPVTIARGYDSRNRTTSGDFGYGWNLSISSVKLSEAVVPGTNWTQESSGSGLGLYYQIEESKPHEIIVDWGNGQLEKFDLVLTPNRQPFVPITFGIAATYQAQSGTTSKLEAVGTTTDLIYNAGMLYTADLQVYNPSEYTLTKADGTVYHLHDQNGILRIDYTNGTTITFDADGIYHSNGETVQITRDAQGRVSSITDPSGRTVTYQYNENGDLTQVTDIGGETVSFTYDASHYLLTITDPRGITVSRNEYDDTGRLVAVIDAAGNRTEFSHDIDGRQEILTDRLGAVTVYVYDDRGNVISQTDANGHTTTYEYDANNQMTKKTDAMNQVSQFQYSADGRLLSYTDAAGSSLSNTYNEKGYLTSISALGDTQLVVSYDDAGCITNTTDADGNFIAYAYDDKQRVTGITDTVGTYLSLTYNPEGRVATATNGLGETASFTYDEMGNCISRSQDVMTENGIETVTQHYTYDAAGHMTQIIYADGTVTKTEYNSIGKLSATVDAEGRRTTYTYDMFGNLTNITYADQTTESFVYDAEGRNIQAADRTGRTIAMTYDAVGNLLTITYPNAAKITYTYDALNRVTSVTDVNGGVTAYEYDVLGRNTAIVNALGNRTAFSYDNASHLVAMTDAKGNTYHYEYDSTGRRTKTIFPDGQSVQTTYDARGRMTSVTDQHGYTTGYTYDLADRLTSVTDADGSVWSYTYNELGSITSVTDANGNTTSYAYDSFGRFVKTTNALGAEASVTYDAAGKVLSTTSFSGITTAYAYDANGRLTSKTTGSTVISYTYTQDGRLLTMTDEQGVTEYAYDAMNGLARVSYPDGTYVAYSYDSSNRLISVQTPFGETRYTYDALNRIATVTDKDGAETLYTYDANGNRSSMTYANGVTTLYTYDSCNRLIKQVVQDTNGTVLESYEITLGAAGERLQIVEKDRTVNYTYDALYRLTQETISANGVSTSTTYTYDAMSNRLSKETTSGTTTYTYNELNQLTASSDATYTYDADGNQIAVQEAARSVTYHYNDLGRMSSAVVQSLGQTTLETYSYNGNGIRIAKNTDGIETRAKRARIEPCARS